MEATDLLAREEEFKKLNKQLEKKTESLMKQIEHAMQKQDIFAEFSHNLTLSPHNTKKHCCDTPKSAESTRSTPKTTKKPQKKKEPISDKNSNVEQNKNESTNYDTKNTNDTKSANDTNSSNSTNNARIICNCCSVSRNDRIHDDLEFLYAFVSVNVQENILPSSFLKERATVENVCKFLAAKVKLMQEQIDKLQSTINKKASQCEVHLTKQAELESERLALIHKANNLQSAAVDAKTKCSAIQQRLDEKDRLYKEQRSETDKLSCEVKRLRSKNATLEARCAKQEDTIDTLTHKLENAIRCEKEFRASTRALSASHQNAISSLELQIKALSTKCHRLEALVENLRKQNALLTANRAVHALENCYNEYLKSF